MGGDVVSFTKILNPGATFDGQLFIEITWDDTRLSVTGVEGPKPNGDAAGSAGQCVDALRRIGTYSPGWDAVACERLATIWDRWHLNDCQAGTPAQTALLRDKASEYPGWPASHFDWSKTTLAAHGLQPDNGYSYGSAWLAVEVPADVLAELQAFPDSERVHPWGAQAGR